MRLGGVIAGQRLVHLLISCFRPWRCEILQLFHLREIPICPRGFLLVHLTDRKPDMHQDVVSDPRIRNVLQTRLASDAPVIDDAHPHAALFVKLYNLSWYGETHGDQQAIRRTMFLGSRREPRPTRYRAA